MTSSELSHTIEEALVTKYSAEFVQKIKELTGVDDPPSDLLEQYSSAPSTSTERI
jgi:hypothetical protein